MKQKQIKIFGLILIIMFSIRTFGFSQIDSVKYPVLDLEIESGIFFNQNKAFVDKYKSKSNFNWSLGITIGSSTMKVLQWIKYSQYQLNIDSLTGYNTTIPLKAKRKQLSVGLVNPFKISSNDFVQIKYGISYNFLSESSTDFDSDVIGFLFSAGYMRQITKEFKYHLDVGYEYSKSNLGVLYRDWSGFYINIGASFNMFPRL
ncbi:MAG: hypothetical protein IMY72_12655 [Bacteroidetes bacterium]|nr:hypothetical protein [Bacteroidota bacterium]